MKWFIIVFAACFFFGLTSWKSHPPEDALKNITSTLVNEVATDDIGSVAITILNRDGISYFKAHGRINKFNTFLPDTATIFRIGSVSKSMQAVLMMKLMEEGFFKPDDPVEKFLPEIKLLKGYSDSTKITFRQLASHTSGLARTSNHVGTEQKGPASEWENRTLAAIPHTRFIARPDSKMSYSNVGYAILALAMSRAAGAPYTQLMTEKVLKPLKMNNTFFEIPDNKMKYLAQGTCDCGVFNHKNTRVPRKDLKGIGYDLPGGGIFSTSADMARFLAVLLGTSKQRLLSRASRSMMQTGNMTYQDAVRRSFHDVRYGIGTVVYHLDDHRTVFAHSGSVPGYWTTYAYDTTKKVAVLIMLNYDKHLDNEGTVVKMIDQL